MRFIVDVSIRHFRLVDFVGVFNVVLSLILCLSCVIRIQNLVFGLIVIRWGGFKWCKMMLVQVILVSSFWVFQDVVMIFES